MGIERDFRAREIARLQFELANASRWLDEIERRSQLRTFRKVDPAFVEVATTATVADMPELRFAANVASGMTTASDRLNPSARRACRYRFSTR
jgi:hypothetical protein